MALTGQLVAASCTVSSGSPSGSTTMAMPSSSWSKVPGAHIEQLPDAMHRSRFTSMRRPTPEE